MGKRKRRYTTYKEWITKEGLLKIEGWARDGLVNEQIAHNIGIAEGTLYNWMNKYSEIDEALKRGKEVVDREVENALLKRALGYSYVEQRQEETEFGSKIVTTTKEVIPDTTAQIFWLKNRKPQQWRDKPTEEDRQEQLSRIEQMKTKTKMMKGISEEIEDTSDLRVVLGLDEDNEGN